MASILCDYYQTGKWLDRKHKQHWMMTDDQTHFQMLSWLTFSRASRSAGFEHFWSCEQPAYLRPSKQLLKSYSLGWRIMCDWVRSYGKNLSSPVGLAMSSQMLMRRANSLNLRLWLRVKTSNFTRSGLCLTMKSSGTALRATEGLS